MGQHRYGAITQSAAIACSVTARLQLHGETLWTTVERPGNDPMGAGNPADLEQNYRDSLY